LFKIQKKEKQKRKGNRKENRKQQKEKGKEALHGSAVGTTKRAQGGGQQSWRQIGFSF
jgi:hypothetical protein